LKRGFILLSIWAISLLGGQEESKSGRAREDRIESTLEKRRLALGKIKKPPESRKEKGLVEGGRL